MKFTFRLISFLIALVAFSGCKKDYDTSVFEQLPQERTEQMLEEYKSILTSAPYGWQAYVYTGYGNVASTFLFRFDSTNRVLTNCDLSTTTVTTANESSYRIQALQMPTLIFDTYSYIHLLADPDPNVIGGVSGNGMVSDFEFYFMQISARKDTLWMSGTSKGMPLMLVKITDDNRADVERGFLQDGGVKMAEIESKSGYYLGSATFLNIKMQDGKQISMSAGSGRSLFFRYLNDTTGKIVNQSTLYSFNAKGIHLRDTIWYKGFGFTDLVWNQGTDKGLYIEGIFNTSQATSNPDFPLSALFGNGFTGMYQPAGYPDQSSSAISQSYRDVIKAINDSLNGRSYTFSEIAFLFSTTQNQMALYLAAAKGGVAYTAVYYFDFTLAGDKKTYTFKLAKQDQGGQDFRFAMAPLLRYFETGSKQMKLDYYQSSSQGMMGQFTSVDDPNFFFVGLPF